MAHHVQTLWWLQNRADGYILRNRIQMQQKPQRRNSFTLRLNGCRADFQNRNIRVCCMDGIMDGTDILPLAAFYPCECHRLFSAIGIAGYGKQMVRVAMNTSNFLGQTSLCKSSIAQSRMCCIALFSASGNPSVQKVPIPQASALRLKSIFQKCAACIHWMQNTRGLGTAQQAF